VPLRIGVLLAAWLVLAVVFAARARLHLTVQRRSRASLIGMAIQAVAFALAWTAHGTQAGNLGAAHEPSPPSGAWALWLAAPILGLSVWLMAASVRTLGKQWSLAAEIQTHHKLIATGPYAYVRHPIYVGTFGMLVGTGLLMTTPLRNLVAVLIYLGGTWIRVREEERLLRGVFGEEYEAYARRVRF
jgi:protein-S-isoprenylcysteine O-methyltransferase Ste14